VLYDDVQYTRRDWRNRNVIKTKDGFKWLTIPVKVKGRYDQLIKETEVTGGGWAEKHWKAIQLNYSRSCCFGMYEARFREAYSKAAEIKMLTEINLLFIELVNSILEINTPITMAEKYSPEGKKGDRILSICRNARATEHLTGPSGLAYLDKEAFRKHGIEILAADYSGYPEYNQQWPPFSHNVSIIDLIFNTGPAAMQYIK
jgi:hypothetical protein